MLKALFVSLYIRSIKLHEVFEIGGFLGHLGNLAAYTGMIAG